MATDTDSTFSGFAGPMKKFRIGNCAGVCSREYHPEMIVSECQKLSKEKALKAGHSTQVYAMDNGMLCKRYLFGTFGKRFRYIFRSRSRKCLRLALHLADSGLPTPQVIASFRNSRFTLPSADYLIQEMIPDNRAFFGDKIASLPQDEQLICLEQAVGYLKKMHDSGAIHGDASFRNFYFDKISRQSGVIDLDGGCFSYSRRRQLRDLARVVSSFAIVTQRQAEIATFIDLMLLQYDTPWIRKIAFQKKLRQKAAEYLVKTRVG